MTGDVRLAAEAPRDLAAAESAAADVLRTLGLSLEAEHLRAAPGRRRRSA